MSYLVIARKYRPQTFASIVGQEHITVALANAIVRDRVPHALLFTGPRGVGKTTTARVLSKALNCTGRIIEEGVDGASSIEPCIEPCGECSNCLDIAKSSSLSVWEIDGASHNGVDSVRDLIDSLRSLPPPGSTYKIYIIDEVHMLSTAAFNALLKSLEEPPPNTIFVFATTEPHKIPATVISRCQRHDFRRVPDPVIVSALRSIAEDQNVQVSDDVLWFVARRSFGGMRDAQSSFDRLISFSTGHVDMSMAEAVFGVVGRGFFFELSQAVFAHDVEKSLLLLDQVFKGSIDLRSFLSDYLAHWRNLMLVALSAESKANGASSNVTGGSVIGSSAIGSGEWKSLASLCDFTDEELEVAYKQIEVISSFDLQRTFEFAEKSAQAALMSNFPRYLLEAGLVKMASLVPARPLAEVVSKLEAWLKSGAALASPSSEVPRLQPQAMPKMPEKAIASVVASSVATPELVSVDVSKSDEATSTSFNPSWDGFVNFVKSKNQVLLSSHLRRVTADRFLSGQLNIVGSNFDVSSLRDAEISANLRRFLQEYSGIEAWHVTFEEVKAEQAKSNSSGIAVAVAGKKPVTKDSYASGSIAQQESEEARNVSRKLEEEARKDPGVQAVLSTFKGSKIERINILDKKK